MVTFGKLVKDIQNKTIQKDQFEAFIQLQKIWNLKGKSAEFNMGEATTIGQMGTTRKIKSKE